METHFYKKENISNKKANTFHTINFIYPPFLPSYYFSLHVPIICVIICFERIIIDIIILSKEKKEVYYCLRKTMVSLLAERKIKYESMVREQGFMETLSKIFKFGAKVG